MITCPNCKKQINVLGIEVLAASDYKLNFEEGEYRQKEREFEKNEKSYKLYCRNCYHVLTETNYYAVADDLGRYDVVKKDLGEYGVYKLP